MRILIIGAMYEPDLGPSAPLFTMLSKALVARGHKVTVIATVPHYPSGQVPIAFRGKWLQPALENGVHVIRVRIPSVHRQNLRLRSLQYLCYQLGATVASLNQHYDVVLAANPFLAVWLPFAWAVVLRNKPAIYSVQDIYPNVGIALGVFRHKKVISAVTAIERFCLSHSSIVQIISDSFRPSLRDLGVADSKMALVYNWVDTDLIHPLNRDNSFAEEHRLTNRFIVLYAGNIGRSQDLEHILTTAEQMKNHPDIGFVFVGDGAVRESLAEQAKQRRLDSVQFIPFQPRERLPEVLASADISLVSLSKGIGFQSVPSKIYSIFASGRPVIASVDENCETWNLVSKANAGICIAPENRAEMPRAILRLKNEPTLRNQLGQNGRTWAEKHHSPSAAAQNYEKLFYEAITSSNYE